MSVLEPVARAMWDQRRKFAAGHHPPVLLEEWGDGSIPAANGIMEEAHAAIEAMRQPTMKMLAPGARNVSYHQNAVDNAHATWTSMIDAALEQVCE